MNNFNCRRSVSKEEAVVNFSESPGAAYIGGGTNLVDLWKYDLVHPETLIDIGRLEELSMIEPVADGGLRLGATATNADTAWHPLVETRYPLLSKAILAGASAQIRNMARNGGNLLQRTRCHYFYDAAAPCNKREPGTGCPAISGHNRIHAVLGTSDKCIAVFPSDMCVALSALNATVNVTGGNGSRSIPFGEFHRLPGDEPERDNTLARGELITSIDLPAEGFAENYCYLKIRDRQSYAFALVSVALGLKIADGKIREARIALGGVAHKPWRIEEAEQLLKGKPPTAENFSSAATVILNGAKGFGYNDFKPELAKRAIIRAGAMALDPSCQIPGAGPSR